MQVVGQMAVLRVRETALQSAKLGLYHYLCVLMAELDESPVSCLPLPFKSHLNSVVLLRPCGQKCAVYNPQSKFVIFYIPLLF